jgi:hypothetical protein
MVLIIKPSKPVETVQKVTKEKAIPQSSPHAEHPPDFVLVGETIAELEQKNRIRSRRRKDEEDATAIPHGTSSDPDE